MSEPFPKLEEGGPKPEPISQVIVEYSNEEAFSFLTSQARDKEFELSQEDVSVLMEKSLSHVASGKFTFSEAVSFVHDIAHDTWQFEEGKEFLIERVFRALPTLAEKYPSEVHELENIIGQEYYVRPEIFLEVAADVYADRHSDPHTKTDLIHSFNYQFAFAGEGYDRAVRQSLDFEDTEHFARTGKFLDFYRHLFSVAQGEFFSEERSQTLEEILEAAVADKKGSYLLLLRAKGLLTDIKESEDGMVAGGYEPMSFDISPQYKGARFSEGIRVLNAEKGDSITSLEAKIKANENASLPPKEEIKAAAGRGESHVTFDVSPTLVAEQRELYGELTKLFRTGKELDSLPDLAGKNDEDIRDYEFLLNPDTRKAIQNEFGITLSDVSVGEQFEFLNFLKGKNADDAENVKEFTKKYGIQGTKTFLSLSYGREFGDKIVGISEKLPEESARAIFAKYAEIVGMVERVPGEIGDLMGADKSKHTANMKETLLRYGRKLLEGFATKAEKALEEADIENLQSQLDDIRADIVLSASLFKSLLQEGTPIAEISGLNLETVQREELSEADKVEMQRIFGENREDYPESLRSKTVSDFEEILNVGEREFHIMKRGDEIIGFARFDPLPNGNLYIGSLNVRPEIKFLTVGGAFLSHLLKENSKEHTIEAEAFSGNKMLQNYTDKYGFRIVGEIPNYHGSGELFYKMEIPKGSLN